MAKSGFLTCRNHTQRIYFIRDQKVMLERIPAELYGVETKALKQAMKRNISRLPEDFKFIPSFQEVRQSRSQLVISS